MEKTEFYTVVGFYLTSAGFAVSLISLFFTIYISNSTRKIRKNLIDDHRKQKFKRTKESILNKIEVSITMIKEDDIVDTDYIEEIIIDISQYLNILKSTTKRRIRKLKLTLAINNIYSIKKTKIAKLLYDIKLRIDDDVDDIEEHIRRVTKWF